MTSVKISEFFFSKTAFGQDCDQKYEFLTDWQLCRVLDSGALMSIAFWRVCRALYPSCLFLSSRHNLEPEKALQGTKSLWAALVMYSKPKILENFFLGSNTITIPLHYISKGSCGVIFRINKYYYQGKNLHLEFVNYRKGELL